MSKTSSSTPTAAPKDSKSDKKPRQRSPNYPAIGLRRAVELAQKFWDSDKRQAVLPSRAFSTFGFTPKSSAGPVTLSAMKKFGLLIDEGEGEHQKVKLSDDAIGILNQSAQNRDKLIKQAALKPQIHRDMWDKFGVELPSDGALHDYLVFERKFTEEAGNALIGQYHDTIEFAKLAASDKVVSNQDSPESEQNPSIIKPSVTATNNPPLIPPLTVPPRADNLLDLPIPLPSGIVAYFRLPASLTELDFSFCKSLLEAYRPGLVKKPEPVKQETTHVVNDE